jgi:alpha-galactosidase
MAESERETIPRREFLKSAGATVGGALIGGVMGKSALSGPRRHSAVTAGPGPANFSMISEFVENPPFSFVYDGRTSGALLRAWPARVQSVRTSLGRVESTVTWKDPATELSVEADVVFYPDAGAREWTIWFTNMGHRVSPDLSAVLAADTIINSATKTTYVLHHFNGSAQAASDYEPFDTPLSPGARQLLYPFGGRPSNGTWPYFNLDWGQRGAMVAIGWPGQWTVDLLAGPDEGLVLRAGMTSADPAAQPYQDIDDAQLLNTTLQPGERVRTPLIVIMDWEAADWKVAQNSWRRWMWQFNLPRYAGDLPTPMLTTSGAVDLYPDQGEELGTIGSYVDEGTTKDHGGFYTHWWVDAGWYAIPLNDAFYSSDPWFYGVGSWYPDPVRFPQGLRPTFAAAAAHGMKSILWSEPERAMASTWLAENHPTWLLGPSGPVANAKEVSTNVSYLVNFGNPDALSWMVDHFDSLISTQGAAGSGINVLRQDFNMDPLDNWNAADAPGRRGMTQMNHVLGHLAFWDELRQRHPHMWIDSCASGGRRNDIETMRRAVPLWRSDYQYDPTGAQCQTYGISFWLPYFGAASDPQQTNDGQYGPPGYVVRSALAPCLISDVDPGSAVPSDWELLRAVNEEFLQVQDDLLYSDFYPLTDYSLAADVWIAFQYNRPEPGTGVLEAFRRPGAPAPVRSFPLKGLNAGGRYRLKNLASGEVEVRTGRSLMGDGVMITLGSAPGAAIVSYALLP